MDLYVLTGMINIIRRYAPSEIDKYIASKINKIIFPTEITHMIFRYAPKEMIKYLINKTYYLGPITNFNMLITSDIEKSIFIKPFDWKRLYYELYKENRIKIEYQYPKKYDDIHLNGLINKMKPITIGYEYEHQLKIMNFGKLYVRGHNNFGQLGLGDNKKRKKWTIVPLKETVISVSLGLGNNHSMLLTGCGKVYVTGSDRFGKLGIGDVKKWTHIKFDEKITQICASGNRSFVLSDNGKLFGVGDNECGQLGLGEKDCIYKWTQINLDEKIKYVECSNNHSLLLTENGNVYGTGQNSFHQLGFYRTESGLKDQRESTNKWIIQPFPEKIIQISCSGLRSMVLTTSGKIYTTGTEMNDFLGSLSTTSICRWKKIKLSRKIVHIKCERVHEYNTIISEDGKKTTISIRGKEILLKS